MNEGGSLHLIGMGKIDLSRLKEFKVENGKVSAFRTRVNLSFKYGGGE